MRSTKPRLLFLCQTLPFPPDSGVDVRAYNVLRLLAREFEVTALCFYRRASRTTPRKVADAVAGLSPLARVEAFAIPQEHSRARLIGDHLRSVLTGAVYTRFVHRAANFERRLKELLAETRFDLVHMDSLDLSACLPLLRDVPVACTHHNVESDLLRRRSEVEENPLLRRYLALQAKLAAREERYWCPRLALNVAVSPADVALFEREIPDARFTLVPNGVDTSVFTPRPAPATGIVFVGGYDWLPNRDAMHYFCESVLPTIRAARPKERVVWVGRAPDAARKHFRERYDVELTGYVDDIRPLVEDAACYIVPLRVGGGTRLKLLDAWAMGKAVVSTTIGAEGLAARDGENILLRDDAERFAAGVLEVLDSSALREGLGLAARETAETIYDWDVIGEGLTRDYMEILAGRTGADRSSGAGNARAPRSATRA